MEGNPNPKLVLLLLLFEFKIEAPPTKLQKTEGSADVTTSSVPTTTVTDEGKEKKEDEDKKAAENEKPAGMVEQEEEEGEKKDVSTSDESKTVVSSQPPATTTETETEGKTESKKEDPTTSTGGDIAKVEKKPATDTTTQPAATTSDANAILEEKGTVSPLYVGRVIGKGGEMIRDLQARSGCRIDVDQNVPENSDRIITYRGTRQTIDFAKKLIKILCCEGGKEADLPLGEASRKHLIVPSTVIGKIIGRGGEMIRELQSKSQAKVSSKCCLPHEYNVF